MSKTVKGIWVFNEVITIFEDQEQVEFTVLGLDLTQYDYREKFEAFSNAIYSGDYDSNNLIYVAVRNDASGTYAKITAYNNPESKWNTYRDYSLRFVNFGEEEQSVSDDFYDWLMNNTIIKGAGMSDGVNVIYGGQTIATIKDQQIAILNCAGEKMTEEIFVVSPKAVEQLPSQEKAIEITSNGTYPIAPDDGYVLSKATAVVNVPEPELEELNATVNAVFIPSKYGFSKVTVNVPIEDTNLIIKNITENGTYKASEEGRDELAGLWMINYRPDISNRFTYNVNFISRDTEFNILESTYTESLDRENLYFRFVSSTATRDALVWDTHGNAWGNDDYRFINITSTLAEVTDGDALLAWLQANATKKVIVGYSKVTVNVASEEVEQVEEWDGSGVVIKEIATNLINFTILSTLYQAKKGMTWSEWVESEYNSSGFWLYGDDVVTLPGNAKISGVTASDTIIENGVYATESSNAGSGN